MARTSLALRLLLPPFLIGMIVAISFLEAGIPAVEFGPTGGGHHGPEEWVSISSLRRYREALAGFVQALPQRLARERATEANGLRAIEGGRAS